MNDDYYYDICPLEHQGWGQTIIINAIFKTPFLNSGHQTVKMLARLLSEVGSLPIYGLRVRGSGARVGLE